MAKSSSPVRATATTIRVVEALQELDGAGVTDIADRLDVPTSTAFDHLRTLERHEFVVKRDDKYEIATRFLEIGGYARSNNALYQIAEPEIQKLAHKTGEHANLMIEEFGRGVFLSKAKGEDAFRLDTHIGKRVNLQTTALGKAILAELPRERIDEIIETHGLPEITEHTITDRDRLFEEIEEVREQGYAVDDEERIHGVRCVAAPINDDGGDVIGAVSVSGPKSGMRGKRFNEEIPEMVLRTANVIQVNLKYQ